MMTAPEKDLIIAMTVGKISEEEFYRRYPVDVSREYQIGLLETAYREQNADDIEHAVLLGYALKYSAEHVDILCRLMVEKWHMQHENIAGIMQELKAPESVDCLYQAAVVDLDYLDYDEAYALAVKCAWALGAVRTEQAREKLQLLAKNENPVKRDAALHQLERLGSGKTALPDN